MTPEERSLLERTHKLAEENNEILRSIRRSNRFSIILRVLYWVVIIFLSYGAYYFVQPYLKLMLSAYDHVQGGLQTLQGGVNTVNSVTNSFKDLLK